MSGAFGNLKNQMALVKKNIEKEKKRARGDSSIKVSTAFNDKTQKDNNLKLLSALKQQTRQGIKRQAIKSAEYQGSRMDTSLTATGHKC